MKHVDPSTVATPRETWEAAESISTNDSDLTFFVLITIRPLEFLQTSASTLVAWFSYTQSGKASF